MTADAALRQEVKSEIRRRRRAVRAALPASARQARSAEICKRVQALEEWIGAERVLAFRSMQTEVQTAALVDDMHKRGIVVAAPRLTEDREDLELARWEANVEMEESGMLFLQPPRPAPIVDEKEIQLVLVPALAVDPRGHRIGFGKGFYDRLLPRLNNATRVALIFDFERVAEVPNVESDIPVHIIVTDARTERV